MSNTTTLATAAQAVAPDAYPPKKLAVRTLLVVVSAILGMAFVPPAGAQTYLHAEEAQTHQLVNTARSLLGRSALPRHEALDAMARKQSVYMADGHCANAQTICHNPNLAGEANAHGLNWLSIGENVGVGPTAGTIHQAFLNSPGHYDNIIGDFNGVGVGVVPGRDGRIFVTHVFAKLADSSPPPAAPVVAEPAPAPAVEPAPEPVPAAPVVAPAAPPAALPAPPSPDPNAVLDGVVDLERTFGTPSGAWPSRGLASWI